MAKLWIIAGALLLIIEISAIPQDSVSNNSPSVYTLGTRRYRGTTAFRNPSASRHGGTRVRQYNATAKTHHQRNLSQAPLLNQMQGKALFIADPDEKRTPTRQSNFVRKSGHSFKLSEKTLNDTIKEVEEMMKDHPHLPRLSRQEMIDIIENITNDNSARRNNQTSGNESREEYIRSLMLVMPFNTNNLSDSMIQDLYTKPPITEIINTTPSTPVTTQKWRVVVGDITREPQIVYSRGTTITTTESTADSTTQKPYSSTSTYTIPRNTEKYKNKLADFGSRQRPKINVETTQKPSTVVEKFTVPRYRVRPTRKPVTSTEEPQSITPKYRIRTTQRPTTVYQYPESTLARLRAKTTKVPFIVTATSVTAKPFKRIPEEVTIPAPLVTDNIPIRKDVKELLATLGLFPVDHANITSGDVATTSSRYHLTTKIPPPFPMDVQKGADTLSPEMQTLLKSFGLLDNEIPLMQDNAAKQITSQLQTSIYNPPPPEPTVDIESYASFKPLPDPSSLSSASAAKSKMGDEMKDFLVSFGLLDNEKSTVSDETTSTEEQKPRKPHYRLRGRKYDGTTYNQRRRDKKKESNSTSPMDLSIDTDILPDNMKGVLKTLGLGTNLERQGNATNATDDSPSGTTLKPDTTTNTQSTTTATSAAEESTTESHPITTLATLTTKRIDQNITENDEPNTETNTTSSVNTTTEDGNSTTGGHIFNPTDAVPNNEDIEHLNKLLKTVRLLANGTTPDELEYILGGDPKHLVQSDEGDPRKEKMTSLEQAKNPPDPLSFEELVHILNEAKNEVKRQQDSNATGSNSRNNATSTPATIEASESAGGPSVEDLAASFGGSVDDEEESELPPPSSRPNGLYFLLDWNSFLEVGEDNSRVNLRFAPKLGDSRNFLPVTVP